MFKNFLAVSAIFLSACSYNVQTQTSPNLSVYSSYTEKIPEKFLLYVDVEEMQSPSAQMLGMQCSAHKFPSTRGLQ